MVNPTGYTALDMIGFTDQGAYSSSDNYVKNDLVHYSGNIWRCLVDDTTGIAPAEGANWTLFIGEPTNLVERIIAPVETDPVTNAWAVGRQIIFNDNLYEVIAAITAGDALIAYEDDPTNANIKLADPVETQLLNVKGNLSNRNLLDNAWFTVNQRGESSYSSTGNSYTVDRWAMVVSGSIVTVNSDGTLTITTPGTGTSIFPEFRQLLEDSFAKKLDGRTLTLSAIVNGELYQASGVYHYSVNETVISVPVGDFNLQLRNIPIATENRRFIVRLITKNSTSVYTLANIKAIKLELGSVSTLAMDTAPNYAEELLKCQRYFTRLSPDYDTAVSIATGYAVTASDLRIDFNLPLKMRTSPSITYSDLADFRYTKTTYSDGSVPTAITSAGGEFGSAVVVKFIGTFTQSDAYEIYVNNAGYIDLSADL